MRASLVSQGILSEEIVAISFNFSLTEGQNYVIMYYCIELCNN